MSKLSDIFVIAWDITIVLMWITSIIYLFQKQPWAAAILSLLVWVATALFLTYSIFEVKINSG